MVFTTWGFTDKYSWLDRPKNGLAWDRDVKPKPAVAAMVKVLKEFDRKHASVVAKATTNNLPK